MCGTVDGILKCLIIARSFAETIRNPPHWLGRTSADKPQSVIPPPFNEPSVKLGAVWPDLPVVSLNFKEYSGSPMYQLLKHYKISILCPHFTRDFQGMYWCSGLAVLWLIPALRPD
jgi:hypothetical protein